MIELSKSKFDVSDFANAIIWQSTGLLVINKPSGMLSHGAEIPGESNAVDLAKAYLKHHPEYTKGLTDRVSVGVIHRLDRNVSGAIMVAFAPRIAADLSDQLRNGEINRYYRAVCRGQPTQDQFTVEADLLKDSQTNQVRVVLSEERTKLSTSQQEQIQSAVTKVKVVERFQAPIGRCTQLEVAPITGRSHQIRVHLAHVGLPIIGDPKYGIEAKGINRPLLHCWKLQFSHREMGEVEVQAQLPWDSQGLRILQRKVNKSQRSHVKF